MLYWALVFFVISLITGLFGMNGLSGVSMDIAQFLFWTFLVLAGIFLAIGITAARKVGGLLK